MSRVKYITDADKLAVFEKRKAYAREYEARRRKENPEMVIRSMAKYWSKKAEQAGKENDNETK